NAVREVMGFLILGTAAWLLWQRRVNGEFVFWTVAFCIFVAFGLWLYGRWSDPLASTVKRFVAPFAGAALIALGGLFCFAVMYEPGKAATRVATSEEWQPYSKDLLAALL